MTEIDLFSNHVVGRKIFVDTALRRQSILSINSDRYDFRRKLTKIINSFQEFFHFEQSEFEEIDDSTFAHRVTTLILRHSNKINLTHYPNIRALKLQCHTKQQFNQTINQSQLEHLYIGHAFYECDTR
ncbi:unnamed protein product [Rotaria sordida]|uniref:Uncharacterized protein n=1 Tax=Rotaria sordida TaxID=392033 RepID=A0A814C8A5_9BILA|nr:unnamed protein product [Rotaria sordida]